MLGQLPSVFLEVVAPVFAIVALGRGLGRRLALDARTVSRTAYPTAVIFSTLCRFATLTVLLALV